MKRLYKEYLRSSRVRNIYWDLTLEQFHALTSTKCSYCGKPPYHMRKHYIYTGIDRLDPKQGYTKENSAPACSFCNKIKSNSLTPAETKVAVEAILKLRRELK